MSPPPSGETRESKVYRDQVPAISTRSLRKDNRFALAEVSNNFLQGRSSALYLKNGIAPIFPIRYVYGFSSDAFSYFMSVQKDHVDSLKREKDVTKIIQICQKDSFFFSYADIPVKCVKDDVDYNILEAAKIVDPDDEELGPDVYGNGFPGDVLLGVFSRKNGGAVDSAVCMYTMKSIRAKFLENIKLCHQGNSTVSGGGYLRVGPRGNCNQQVSLGHWEMV